MKKRSEVPRMKQMDLFATQPPPAPKTVPPDPVVAAAESIEKVRRKRSELTVPFVTGPISDASGGPLSAAEAERVMSGKTIRCSGFQWQNGAACCKGCLERVKHDPAMGYRATLYGGAEYKGGLTCIECKRPIPV